MKNKPFLVAELSANHLGSLARALRIVDAAADAGADAIKLQTWSPGTMCLDKTYRIGAGPWKGIALAELYSLHDTPWSWHERIFQHARDRDLVAFSTPFDAAAVDFLETLNCPMYKVSSFELVDLPLIRYIASKAKPIIISTGMATNVEIADAWIAAQPCHTTMLKCTSAYPASCEQANLETMQFLGVNYGLSDHTPGMGTAIAAAVMGASIVEKHLTLSRADGGPDAAFSMEPREFAQMVTEIRRAVSSIGTVKFGPQEGEHAALRRSLYFTRAMAIGDVIEPGDVATARPSLGDAPANRDHYIGKMITSCAAISRGTPVSPGFIA